MTAQEIMKELDGIISTAPVVIGDTKRNCFGEYVATKRCKACESEDECKESRAAAMKIVADELAAKQPIIELEPVVEPSSSIDEIEALVNAELNPAPAAPPAEALPAKGGRKKKTDAPAAEGKPAADPVGTTLAAIDFAEALKTVDPAVHERSIALAGSFAKGRQGFIVYFIGRALEQAADRKKARELYVECCAGIGHEPTVGETNYDVNKLFKLLA